MRLAWVHPAPPALDNLERVRLEGDSDQPQPILGRGQWTVLVGRLPTGRARLPIETPRGHMGLERALKRREQGPKLLQGETGQLQHRRGAGLDVGEPSIPHGCDLLSSEAQSILNRHKLYYMPTRNNVPHFFILPASR
jgi:hypothetical protein